MYSRAIDIAFEENPLLTSRDNKTVIDSWIIENHERLRNGYYYSLLKGKKAHLIVMQNGNLNAGRNSRHRTGLWFGGTRIFSTFEMSINGKSSLDNYIKTVRRLAYTYRDYTNLERIDYIVFDKNAYVIELKSKNKNSLTNINLNFKMSHGIMWPQSKECDHYASTLENKENMVIKSDIDSTRFKIDTDGTCSINFADNTLSIYLSIKENGSIVVSKDDEILSKDDFERNISYHNTSNRYAILETSSFELNKAFFWAKHDILEFYSETEVGNGFYAGFPEFSWFFGRDGLWTSIAAIECGMENLANEHMKMLYRYSKNGRIPHEIPLIKDQDTVSSRYSVSGELSETRYMSIDSNPLWVISFSLLSLWTKENTDLKDITEVMNFIKSCQSEDDGLLENNFEKGLIGWPETWSKSRDGKCIDINALWIEAARAYKFITKDKNIDVSDLEKKFLSTFYNPKSNVIKFVDSIYKGEGREIKSPMLTIPCMFFRGEMFSKILSSLSGEDMMTPAGIRSMSTLDPMYDRGYHTGQIWPLMTGWYVLAAYNNRLKNKAWDALKTFISLSFSSPEPGRINEVYDSEFFYPIGQFAQAWSSSLLVQSVIEGMFGLKSDWKADESLIHKIQNNLPEELKYMRLLNVKYQNKEYDISIDKQEIKVLSK